MLALAAAIVLRVEVLTLLHPHTAQAQRGGVPLELRAEGDQLIAGGARMPSLRLEPARVTVPGLGVRAYAGALEVRAQRGELIFVNEVPLEEYVAAVVGSELADAPAAAQAALAVVARSYAVHAAQAGASLCDTTRCQLYLGRKAATRAARRAARATEGQVLQGARGVAPALHSADCGGHTARARDVWPKALPEDDEAGQSVQDPVCAGSSWQLRLDLRKLGASSLRVVEAGPDGLVRTALLDGRPLSGEEVARAISRVSRGVLPSPRFAVEPLGGPFVRVRGAGHGHGVGFCQCGAAALATRGADWHQILAQYFPGLRVSRLP